MKKFVPKKSDIEECMILIKKALLEYNCSLMDLDENTHNVLLRDNDTGEVLNSSPRNDLY